ncbi:Uncharacterized protein QTN25_000556 [Entamoeba marina]
MDPTTPKLDLSAKAFVPRGRRNKSSGVGGSTGSTQSARAKLNSSANQQPFLSTPAQQQPRPNPQPFKKLLYWEPKDSNGYPLDEAYCIECMPSEFWQKYGDLNDTINFFQKHFNVEM